MISGFKIFAGMYVAMIAPPPEATNINGNIFPTIFKSTLPERKNFNALVNVLKNSQIYLYLKQQMVASQLQVMQGLKLVHPTNYRVDE